MRGERDEPDQVLTDFGVGQTASQPAASPGRVPRVRRSWAGLLGLIGGAVLLVPVAIGAMTYSSLLPIGDGRTQRLSLIIGDWFPTWLDIAIVATAIGVSALVVSAMLAPPDRLGRSRAVPTGAVLALTGLVLVSLIPTTVVSAVQLVTRSDYSVLPETSPGGCRIVVIESSTLLEGSGSAGVLRPGTVVVEWIRDFSARSPGKRFAQGRYTLTWDGETADLQAEGLTWRPFAPLACNE